MVFVMKLTIQRETLEIFTVKSDSPYWSDGTPIAVRVAFDKNHVLSSIRAQSIDRANGKHSILISPIAFKNIAVLTAAGGLMIGDSETVTVNKH